MGLYRVNLLPKELQPQSAVDIPRLRKYLVITLVVFTIIYGCIAFGIELNNKREQIIVMTKELSVLAPIAQKVHHTREQRLEVEGMASQFHHILNNRIKWFLVMGDINHSVPQGTWLSRVTLHHQEESYLEQFIGESSVLEITENNIIAPQYQTMLVISGSTESLSSLGLFIHNLQQLVWFEEIHLVNGWQDTNQGQQMEFIIQAFLPKGDSDE